MSGDRVLLRVEGLGCGFAGSGMVLGPVSFAVGRGELLVVVGPSGSGKSTLLRAIAGLEGHRGEIAWAGGRGTVGVVFQEPRLMPWLDVRANVGFGLGRVGRRERVAELLRLVGLAEAGELLPKQLSGGMAQRAALARGLAGRPDVLLLDEPFSALDPGNRARLGEHLRGLQARLGTTMVLVTHDVAEAGRLGDRVLVLGGRPGRVVAEVPGLRAEADGAAWRGELAALLREPVAAGTGGWAAEGDGPAERVGQGGQGSVTCSVRTS